MIEQLRTYIYLFCFSFLLTGCVVYPTKHFYFEPNATDGKTYDSTPCGHLSEEHDEIKFNYDKTTVAISAHYRRNKNLLVTIVIEPRGNNVDYDAEQFSIVDNLSNDEYSPIDVNKHIRTDRVAIKGEGFASEEVLRHWITITYNVLSNSLSDFKMVFPEGAIKINSTPLKSKTINYLLKKIGTIGYGSINC